MSYKMIHQCLFYSIFQYLGFESKHSFKKINKNCNKLSIKDLYNIDIKYLRKLNDVILLNYPNVTQLRADCNKNINVFNNLNKLEKLSIQYVDTPNDCIMNLTNLTALNVTYNKGIKNLNHLTKLEILYARAYCGITNSGVRNLTKIKILDISQNIDITKISHMKNLKYLNINGAMGHGCCNITNAEIIDLDLEILFMFDNFSITDISHLKNLKFVDIEMSKIDKSSIINKQTVINDDESLNLNTDTNTYDNNYVLYDDKTFDTCNMYNYQRDFVCMQNNHVKQLCKCKFDAIQLCKPKS